MATNILTLDGGTPTITVNALGTAKVARLNAQINATPLGFTKAGAGTLVLGNTANTGNIIVSAGTLTGGVNASGNAGLGTGQITLQGGATLNTLVNTSNTWTSTNALVVPTGQTGNISTTNRMQMRRRGERRRDPELQRQHDRLPPGSPELLGWLHRKLELHRQRHRPGRHQRPGQRAADV